MCLLPLATIVALQFMTINYSTTVNCRVDSILHGYFDVHLHVRLYRYLSWCAAHTQRSLSTQRINYSVRKSLLCLNSTRWSVSSSILFSLLYVCVTMCVMYAHNQCSFKSGILCVSGLVGSLIDCFNAKMRFVAMYDDD